MQGKFPAMALAALLAVPLAPEAAAFERKPSYTRKVNPERQRDRDSFDPTSERTRVTSIPLRIEASPKLVEILDVVLATDHGLYGRSAVAGIVRDSLDKLPLGKLPVIGGLFGSKTSGRLRREQQVGNAYSNGKVLVITTWPAMADSSQRLEILPKDPMGLSERLRRPADAARTETGRSGGGLDVSSIVIANQKFRYEIDLELFAHVDAETIMLGGRPAHASARKSGTPLLGDLPAVGWLFQGRVYLEENELVVLIKPTIIRAE